MTIYKFTRLTAPPTLEKQRDVLEAFRALADQDDELIQWRRAEIAAIRRDLEDLRRSMDALRRQATEEVRTEILEELKARKYSPDQPRVPAGSSHGGEWTSESSGSTVEELKSAANPQHEAPQRVAANDDRRVVSDAPDPTWAPGARSAQYQARRGGWNGGPVMVNGQLLEPTPGQAARLAIAESNWQAAIARAKEVDPSWHPTPGFEDTVEGLISNLEAETKEAENYRSKAACYGATPGPYAGESVPARGPQRDFTAAERAEINRIGSETGCNTCGTTEPGTSSGNFVLDHQPPNALSFGRAQRLYPQCLGCSLRQGGYLSQYPKGSR